MAKVYNNGTWEDCVPRVLKDGADTFTTLPAKIYTNNPQNKIVTLGINGNTVQNGTPTPDAPVAVEGCGTSDNGRYKIPVTLGSQTRDIYFDTTTTTRRIKKFVLTGNENWEEISGAFASRTYFRCIFAPLNYCIRHACVSSHFTQASITTATTTVGFDVFDSTSVNGEVLAIRPTNVQSTTLTDFKAWLATQYAAGTPVTGWYAITEPETTTTNKPLMKIGNYADSVSVNFDNVSPGEKEISVGTLIQPRSVVATHKGWHEQQELIRQNGEWTTSNVQQLNALQSPLSFTSIDENEDTEEGGEEYEFER